MSHEVTCKIPFIHGCIVQWYGIEPRIFTDAEPDDPTFIILVSYDQFDDVAVWGAMSLFSQVIRIGRYGTRIWHIICFDLLRGSPLWNRNTLEKGTNRRRVQRLRQQ